MTRVPMPLLVTLLLVAAGAGCASRVTIPAWQQRVTGYVRDRGGDPVVLREITLAGDRPGFAVIGGHDPADSTDANGVLLGHEQVGGRLWVVYLVGLVEEQRVTDIRLAALSMNDGRATWKRGKESNEALQRYRAYGERQARERFPERRKPPPRYLGFPRPDDAFKLTNDGGRLLATHQPSGARWELFLARNAS